MCLFLLLLGSVAYGQQPVDEQILSFHSDVVIAADGTVTVTEHIRVYASGEQIKRGIVRRIPLTRADRNGNKREIGIEVLAVLCNGSQSDYRNKREGDMRVIYVGSGDVLLSPGEYTYEITYSSRGHVGFFDDYDELYWNVTGNEWDFAIVDASATVTLPQGVSAIAADCYTGAFAQAKKNGEVKDEGNTVSFHTTAPLSPGEGLTVAVSFPRGIIERPAPPTALALFWQEYGRIIGAVVCLLLWLIYCWITWVKVGRDPRKPVVIPTFRPPHDWSAGLVRYLYKRKSDDTAFTATLVSMAVKKAILINCEDKAYTLQAKDRVATLAAEEQVLYDSLFTSSKTLVVTEKNHTRIAKATLQLEKALSSKVDLTDYYLRNLTFIGWGGLVAVAVLVLYILISPSDTGAGTHIFVVSLGLALIVSVVYAIYIWLIKAPTPLGATVSAELEGFRMYLKTAEEYRLNLLTPPEQTPELFERMLPYAIALDVENEWSRKFESVLKHYNYAPDWYKGSEPLAYGAMAASFTTSVNNACIDHALSSSSSSGGSWSSGSGGGGFSGGGGGGGGGGGW